MAAKSTSKSITYEELCEKVPKSFTEVTGIEWNELLSGSITFKQAVERSAVHVNRQADKYAASSSKISSVSTSPPSLEEELELLRKLMLLANTRPTNPSPDDVTLKKCVSINFTFLLVGRANGLRKWITASFDLDDTSQTETTFDQRFISASKVVTYVPVICVKLSLYYHLIAKQIWNLLLDKTLDPLKEVTRNCIRKLCNMIISSMIDRSKELGRRELILPVINSLNPKLDPLEACIHGCRDIFDENQLKLHPCRVETPQHSLEVIYSLLFGLKLEFRNFAKSSYTFAQILYIRLALEKSVSHWKGKCDFILKEMLTRLSKKSIHLLISALFIHYDEYCDAFCVACEECGGPSTSTGKLVISFSNESSATSEINVEKIDQLSSISLKLVDSCFESETKVNFILLLFDELSRIHLKSKSTGLLLCALLGELMESLDPLVQKHPGLFIRFLVASLDRAVKSGALDSDESSDSTRIPLNTEESHSDEAAGLSILHLDSVQISLQIIRVLLLHKQKLSTKDVEALKSVKDSLVQIRENFSSLKMKVSTADEKVEPSSVNLEQTESTVEQINELIEQISSLSVLGKKPASVNEKNELEEVLKDLNDPIMPTRAHALITIKHMIVALNPLVIERKKQLLELLIACLSDAESYIYLAAIGTLEMAARLDTATVLPVLLAHYCNQQRTIQERLNTGEAIVRLSKCLGPTAPIYAKSMINSFTDSLTDEEALIRVSSLSNLGQVCKSLRHSLSPYITHIMHSVCCLLTSDASLDVKRSALMFIHLTLSGIDTDCIHVSTHFAIVAYFYECSIHLLTC